MRASIEANIVLARALKAHITRRLLTGQLDVCFVVDADDVSLYISSASHR